MATFAEPVVSADHPNAEHLLGRPGPPSVSSSQMTLQAHQAPQVAQMQATRGGFPAQYIPNAQAQASAAGYPAQVQANPGQPVMGPTGATIDPLSLDALATGTGGHPRGRGALDACSALLKGLPAMDVVVRFKRSWSIQEALEQHSSLCRQQEILSKIGTNRLRVRQTQVSFAEIEVEDAVDCARRLKTPDAADARITQALADRVRRVSHDLALALRLRRVEEAVVQNHIALAEVEIEKSRREMKAMKEAIDDTNIKPVSEDTVNTEVDVTGRTIFYCTNCKVGGHGQRFCEYFLKRPNWRVYPNQKWFTDEKKNEYHCPLGKKMVDFADESHFSRYAMYLKGRIWLEEKTRMWDMVPDLMPTTYVIEDQKWKDGKAPPPDDQCGNLPWFVKEADRNWGTSVHACRKASECMGLAQPGAVYVVQQHYANPLLMDDGRKSHIKFYVFLMCLPDGKTWRLYTFKEGYLSISPNPWSPEDISKETQVTIIRSERIGGWRHWPHVYPKCKERVGKVIERAVAQGKLEGRLGKTQFEIMSADFCVDKDYGVWLLEFNMSPVLKDPEDAPKVNDADMINGALSIVAPWDQGDPGNWDFVAEFVGEAPKPKEPPPPSGGEQNTEQVIEVSPNAKDRGSVPAAPQGLQGATEDSSKASAALEAECAATPTATPQA